jgi:hypothetical protein
MNDGDDAVDDGDNAEDDGDMAGDDIHNKTYTAAANLMYINLPMYLLFICSLDLNNSYINS